MPPITEAKRDVIDKSIDKPKVTKSRTGCLTCKRKRLKCDETKPACLKCVKKNIVCGGYATRFKWRSFNDNNDEKDEAFKFANESGDQRSDRTPKSDVNDHYVFGSDKLDSVSDRRQSVPEDVTSSARSPDGIKRYLELASLSLTGKTVRDIKKENDLIDEGINPLTYLKETKNESTSKNNARLFANLGDSSLDLEHPAAKKLKRSKSHSGDSLSPATTTSSSLSKSRPHSLNRSHSTSNHMIPNEVLELRSNNSRFGGALSLNSLAEAAVDEINTRSPDPPISSRSSVSHKPHLSSDINPSPLSSGFLSPASSIKHGKLPTKLNKSASAPSPKDHQLSYHNSPSSLNLSPSLAALINNAYNYEDEFKNTNLDESIKLDIPLSPLNLQHNSFYDFLNNDNHLIPSPGTGAFSTTPGIDPMNIMPDGPEDSPKLLTHHNNSNGSMTVANKENPNNNNDSKRFKSLTAFSPTNDVSSPITFNIRPNPANSQANNSLNKTAEHDQILGLYNLYTAEILSIKNGSNENPWRMYILPLANDYSCLFNSIASITLFHLSGNKSVASNKDHLRAKGYMYMKRCILELASGLSALNGPATGESSKNPTQQQLPADLAIVICLNLAISETWDKHISSGIAHLKGAKTMIQNVLSLLRETQEFLSSNRRMLLQNKASNMDEYKEGVSQKKKQLKEKMVLVEDSEWDIICFDDKDIVDGKINLDDRERSLTIPKSTQFFFNIWIYFEVLAQMTTESDEKGIDLVASITTILHESKNKQDNSSPSSVSSGGNGIMPLSSRKDDGNVSPSLSVDGNEPGNLNNDIFGIPSSKSQGENSIFDNFDKLSFNHDQVDPILGCAQSLFLIMGKVASLISKIRKSRKNEKQQLSGRNTLSIITTATHLRQQLINWKPTISAAMIEQANSGGLSNTSTSDLSSCIATAEAYRYSTLLYLHQAVPEIPSLSSHQLAEKIFILLASIPTDSPTYTVHIFPLLVSSCEAEPEEEREWCQTRWKLLANRLWIGNVDSAYKVVKEVWKRKNEYVRMKNTNQLDDEDNHFSHGKDSEKFRNISTQISGLMAAVNNDGGSDFPVDDITGGIDSKLHWSSVMKEWGWEVLLG